MGLSAVLEVIGGPSVSAREIEWVRHVPTGRALLDWIDEQTNSGGPHRVELREVALETEELEILSRAKKTSPALTLMSTAWRHDFAESAGPSGLRNAGLHLNAQRQLTREYHARSDYREIQWRALQCDHSAAATEIASSETDFCRKLQDLDQESISLSVRMDETTLSVSNSLHVLSSKGCDRRLTSSSETCTTGDEVMRSSVVKEHGLSLNARSVLTSLDNTFAILERWHTAVETSDDPPLFGLDGSSLETYPKLAETARDTSYVSRLNDLIRGLGGGSRPSHVIRSDENFTEYEAWTQDRKLALRLRLQLADELRERVIMQLLPSALLVHAISTRYDTALRGIWALNEATSDEMDNWRMDPTPVRQIRQADPSSLESAPAALMKQLSILSGADRPVTIVVRDDLIDQAQSINRNLSQTSEAAQVWSGAVETRLSSFSASTSTLQATLHQHSAMPSMPPLQLPDDARNLRQQAKIEADDLRQAIASLEQITEWSGRARTRVDAFIHNSLGTENAK